MGDRRRLAGGRRVHGRLSGPFDLGPAFLALSEAMTARTLVGRSALGLGIYSLCVVFVFSFLLFEVLDVDGSDFPVSATQAIAAEAPHADVRRLHMDLARDIIVLPRPAFSQMPVIAFAPRAILLTVPALPAPPARHHRLLARVSLDVPSAA